MRTTSATAASDDACLLELQQAHGPLMTGKALWRALGFQSGAAFRQAARRGRLPVATFRLPHRRGRFAKTECVAQWLAAVMQPAEYAVPHQAIPTGGKRK